MAAVAAYSPHYAVSSAAAAPSSSASSSPSSHASSSSSSNQDSTSPDSSTLANSTPHLPDASDDQMVDVDEPASRMGETAAASSGTNVRPAEHPLDARQASASTDAHAMEGVVAESHGGSELGAEPSTAGGAAGARRKGKAKAKDRPPPSSPPASSHSRPSSHKSPRTTSPSPRTSPTSPATPHVDIVSYPPSSLLRLLASLLEQIAQANDALNLRSANSSSNTEAATPPTTTAGSTSAPPPPPTEESDLTTASRFDAAPLNSPATPFPQQSPSRSHPTDTFPVTPGVDLARHVSGSGVADFMPSLGGAHSPMPLSRRRGSSFLTNHHPPPTNRTSSSSSNLSTSSHANTSSSTTAAQEPPLTSLLTASSVALSSPTSTLCFHARNIPAISIEAYLMRILKYCPTTNEVFLSLLVYFDRMARVGLEARRVGLIGGGASQSGNGAGGGNGSVTPGGTSGEERMFAIDSFNVHRLIIAGVTVASKFFSDVFYTNSRYAKVGGLPLTELNQLELQFLLLNDFRLMIPTDELQRYADQLLLFWVGRNPPLHSSLPLSTSTAVASGVPQTPSATNNADVIMATTPGLASGGSGIATPRTGGSYLPSGMAPSPSGGNNGRPRSIRSQPSSSGTSVTSTVTPGTPGTERGMSSASENEEDGEGSAETGDGEVEMEED